MKLEMLLHKDLFEVIAYAVEELVNHGFKPSAFSAEANWFKRVKAFFETALRKFGFTSAINPQDLVDLAYGAAHIKTEGIVEAQAPRYSVANAAIANAKDTADKLFTGPSATKNIIDRTIEGFAGPDKFKKVGKLSETVRTKLADKAAPWKDFLQGVHQGKVLDDMGHANAVERIELGNRHSDQPSDHPCVYSPAPDADRPRGPQACHRRS
jgi:hypothetical protein